MSPGDVPTVLRRALAEARDDDVATTAQALAYSLFLAIPATLLVVLGVFSLAADATTVESLIERMRAVLPEEAATLLRDSLRRTAESTSSGLLMTVAGLALALWTTTSAATTLMKGVTTAFDRDDGRRFVRKRLVALVIVVALVASAALIVGLLVLGPHLERWVGEAAGVPSLTAWLWWSLQWPVLVAGLLFAFGVVLYLAPDVEQGRWQLVLPGAVAALVVWLLASVGLALYSAGFGSYEKTWGTLSAVVVTLVWLWLTSAALLLGAEINAEAQRVTAGRGDPPARRGSDGGSVERADDRQDERGDQQQKQELRQRDAASDGEDGEDEHE
ncbi:MAG TPA: YihY/virulence factor BrkB family protein [Gaiellaceae bacterium]|nr:YihY/virulence factor BrkB family protein [Gaiellaceae bacterium]